MEANYTFTWKYVGKSIINVYMCLMLSFKNGPSYYPFGRYYCGDDLPTFSLTSGQASLKVEFLGLRSGRILSEKFQL